MSSPVLELRSITAGYGTTTILRDVDLVVGVGEVVALLGPNGAGKTTLLRAASGLLRPQSGSVLVGGDDMTRRPPHARARKGLCLIPEGRGVWGELTVAENLRLQVPSWSDGQQLSRVLEAFPILGERMDQRAGSMSGGQQQMLALARGWLSNPACVLLDEVSMGLAPRVVDEIFVALRSLAAQGTALLLVEQYIDRALAIADRVQILDRGRTTLTGAASSVDRDAIMRGYLGATVANGSAAAG
jgi:branched-chain amino acid transport system ATP-binding protein